MVTVDDITKYIAPLIPYAKYIIEIIMPIYITIGTFFANISLKFLNILPDPTSSKFFIIIAIVIAVIGLILGIVTDPERKKE